MPSSPPLRLLFFESPDHVDFAKAEMLGFGQVVIPAGDASSLAEVMAQASMPVLMDVVLDRIALASLDDAGPGAPFALPDEAARLDPRLIVDAEFAHARLSGPEDAQALAGWWGARLRAWQSAGLAGFRLLGLTEFPDHLLAPFCTVLRESVPGAILLGWTPGMRRGALRGLAGSRLDGVFASLPWWDFQSEWLWDEIWALRDVAPVLGAANAPFGPGAAGRLTGAPSDAARLARALGMAATLGQGWMHLAGAEAPGGALDLSDTVQQLNAWLRADAMTACLGTSRLPLGDGGPILAVVRCDAADHRAASRVSVTALNIDPVRRHSLEAASILPALGGRFGTLLAWPPEPEPALAEAALGAGNKIDVGPGGLVIFTAEALATQAGAPDCVPAAQAARAPRLSIELVSPSVDGGLFPVKRVAGEMVRVQADIVFDGHDQIAAALRWRGPGEPDWRESPMRLLDNDRWQGEFPLGRLGRHDYVVIAWRDRFATYRDELAKKSRAGLDVKLELIEGQVLLREAAARAGAAGALEAALADLQRGTPASACEILLSQPVAEAMAASDDRPFLVASGVLPVDAERIEARYASWYEVFPRSLSDDTARHGSFADVERHLPRMRDMGFDVLYFPPIHPIGRKNRKGRNNSLTPAPDDPGSPYAIGAAEGGHDRLHPELGSLADFQRLRAAAAAHGLELAMDFAIQCSPDHPWLREHPGWFDWRPDGTIRYAENPPKKYEDIVNVDFYARQAVPSLWEALRDVVLFWAGEGVRLFRVDNPHTKPFPFWQWLIAEVRGRYPDAAFLAEAFTRPKIMYRLAKIGFSQSYTYFTWRNEKRELEAYFTELADGPAAEYFRPHLFVNTPDINPVFLQNSGRPGFLIRAALAATLSGLWGVYNGFELCEADAVPGKEEYLNSEKYQLRAWDWDRPGNIVAEITQLNQIRRRNPALQTHLGVQFHNAFNDAILYYEKATADRGNVLLVAVSLDPFQAQEADVEVPLWNWGLPDHASVAVEDLLTGARFVWTGKRQHLRLTPELPYAIFRLRPA